MGGIKVLLVEDNPGDALLAKEAMLEAKVLNEFFVCENGEVAIDVILQRGEYVDFTAPDLILLDMHLPKKDGGEVLEVIRNQSACPDIPVIVMTGSGESTDVLVNKALKIDGYVSKPVNFEKLAKALMPINRFGCFIVVKDAECLCVE